MKIQTVLHVCVCVCVCVCVLGLFVLAFWAALKNEQVKTTAVTSPSVERTALLRGN